MRVLKEIVEPHYKATVFHWNNKYLLKLETPMLEQTFKVSEFDVNGDVDVIRLLTPGFIEKAMQRFTEMSRDLQASLESL